MLPNFSYIRPGSLAEAIAQLSSDGAVLHAGGTDLLGCLRDGVFTARNVVSITGIDHLRTVAETREGGLGIGALATLADMARHPLVRLRYAALSQAASEVGSPQLRNQGTLGGNLCQRPRCWYYRGEFHCLRKGGTSCYAASGDNRYHCIFGGAGCYIVHPSDTAPALAALDAAVRIAGPEGMRTLPLAQFFVLPAHDMTRENVLRRGEVVTEVVLPAPPHGLRSAYRKVRARRSWDFALAGAAVALVLHGDVVAHARIVLSGVAPVPWRAQEAEDLLMGKPLDATQARAAAAAAVGKAQALSGNGYKIPLIRGLVEEELLAISKEGQ